MKAAPRRIRPAHLERRGTLGGDRSEKSPPGPRAPTRRRFVQLGLAAACSAASLSRARGASERIRIGLLGYGQRGRKLAGYLKDIPGVEIAAVAEAYRDREKQAVGEIGGGLWATDDFRRILDRGDVDAVLVATPDHWHALMTLMACAAGKDVYVEKPLTRFVREGRWMVDAAHRHRRIVQVGTQQRSAPHYQRARRLIREGNLGRVASALIEHRRNIFPGFGRPSDRPPPPGLHWDMFTGPAPLRPYNPNRGLYHFRWFWDYSGGQLANWGAHSVDVVQWFLDAKGPTGVFSSGGREFLDDNCETPDVQDTILEYPGWRLVIAVRECSKGHGGGPVSLYGTNGSLGIHRGGFHVTPDVNAPPANALPRDVTDGPAGSPQREQVEGPPKLRTERVRDDSGSASDMVRLHLERFLDCVRSRREPAATLEQGHRAATTIHLANISLRRGRLLRWDPEREEIPGDRDAAADLELPYREPWDRELRSLRS